MAIPQSTNRGATRDASRIAQHHMSRTAVLYTALTLTIVVALVLLYLLTPRAASSGAITVAFGGLTTNTGAPAALLSINNQSGRALKVMPHYSLETFDMPHYSSTNHIIGAGFRLRTGTNLVLAPAHSATLVIPLPSDVNRCRVSFEFARANFQTQLAEYLQRPHGPWVKCIPESLRALYIIRSAGCEISLDPKRPNN